MKTQRPFHAFHILFGVIALCVLAGVLLSSFGRMGIADASLSPAVNQPTFAILELGEYAS